MNKHETRITVNQIGYPQNEEKRAFFYQKGPFRVINTKTGEVAYQGTASEPINDEKSGTIVYEGNFSPLETPGTYIIEQNETFKSFPFAINQSPYIKLHRGLLKAFYFFRCGMDLTEEFAGPWKHAACHTSKAKVYGEPDRMLDSSGGWHDAGDYGKYTAPGAKAVADLLLAYDLYPDAFGDSIPLPESDGQMPDVLHECRYELEWLFKMQDNQTNGVFHKLTKLQFAGLNVMPEDDLKELYFSPISATATGTFAAVMALASRIYQSFDNNFSNLCLNAALKAWKWLEANPDVPGFKNPPVISTGEYGDPIDLDERYWAAGELYRTTGEESYLNRFQELSEQLNTKESLGWADVSGYGTLSYLLNDKADSTDAFFQMLKESWLSKANSLLEQSKTDGHRISLSATDYIWGSNMVLMNHAMTLLMANHMSKNPAFESCALDHVHYLLGRNVLDISYVTGFGDRSVKHPHHRPSIGDTVVDPVPGLVAGGPNQGLQDEIARDLLRDKPKAQAFIDHKDSYSTNEVAIYWNSPALFVVSHFIK